MPDPKNQEMDQNLSKEEKDSECFDILKKYYESEEKYKFLFNNGNDAIFFHELGGKFIEVNEVACRNLGYTRDELLNMSPKDLDEPHSGDPKLVQSLIENGYAVGQVIHRRKDGTLLPVELSTRLINLNGKNMILSIVRDIRERKKTEEIEKQYKEQLERLYKEAKENSMKMEALNRIIRVINISLDFKEVVNTFAEETYKLFEFDEMIISLRGEDEATFLEKHRITWGHNQPIEAEPASRVHMSTEPYATVFRTGQPLMNLTQKEIECMSSSIMVPINFEGQIEGTFALNSSKPDKYKETDLSFLLSLAEQLGIALNNARLHEKVQKMAVVLERNRLAQEIHDSTLQILSYFRAKGELLERMVEKNSCQSCLNISKEIQQAALEAYNDTREAIHALSAETHKGQKFENVLNNYLTKFSQRWNIKMKYEVRNPFPYFEKDTDLQLLRVVQEALANVRKHSRAQSIQIIAQKLEAGYAIDIEDDGIGFDPKEDCKNSFGIKVMNERMTSIGGHLKILSERGKGTCVKTWIPLQEGAEDIERPGRNV